MSKSSRDSTSTSRESARGSRKRLGGKLPASPPSQVDQLTEDLIGSMKRLSRDEARRKKLAKELF
jgi:hypothetical protein